MFSIRRHLYSLNRGNYKVKFVITKAYYCDKKKIIETLEKPKEDKTEVQNIKSSEEIKTPAFENEEQILQTVMIEKERDANVRSRLSKECNKLSDKRVRLSSTGLNLHLEQNTTKNTCWEDYMFDNTIDDLKKLAVTPAIETKGVCESVSSVSKLKRGADGPTTTTNRIIRGEPGKVLFAFIPKEWFRFFIPKTGVTGFGTFLFTFGTYLISKEIYVLEHNFYNGLGVLCTWWGAIKYVGPHAAKYLDREVDNYEKTWQQGRDETKNILEEQIEHEKLMQFQADGQPMLIEAKRENVHLQLEEEFRLRQMMVHREVLKRLNYQIVVAEVYKRIFHRNLIDYVTKEVKKSITLEMEQHMINNSIDNLVAELEKSDNKH